MSRSSALPPRSLTLTEELERLEQSITLTLQEIDANFSKAHRIVTSSILPIVEQYAKSSDAVWEGSKFWKQFFEASANVSLSSYEEPAEQDEAETALEETTEATNTDDTTNTRADNDTATPSAAEAARSRYPTTTSDDLSDSSLLDSPSLHTNQTTPRRRANSKPTATQDSPSFADYPSPYEALKQEMTSTTSYRAIAKAPATPGSRIPTYSAASTPAAQSSPFLPASAAAAAKSTTKRLNPDPLLHRVLDKNYRIQATPHTTTRTITSKGGGGGAPAAAAPDFGFDSSPYSPAPAAPQLRSEIFGTPLASRTRAAAPTLDIHAPRTPGISIQHSRLPQRTGGNGTPRPTSDSTRRTLFTPAHQRNRIYNDDFADSDTEADPTLSPPKTIQFHIPMTQQRLMQTPAREASRRIVEDLMQDAGMVGESTVEIERLNVRGLDSEEEEEEMGNDVYGEGGGGDGEGGEDSPSVIRVRAMGEGGEDDDAFGF